MKFPTPLFVTGESVDPDFDEAFIELDEQRSDPVPDLLLDPPLVAADHRIEAGDDGAAHNAMIDHISVGGRVFADMVAAMAAEPADASASRRRLRGRKVA